VAGMPLADYCRREGISLSGEVEQRIFHQTRNAAYEIIQRKGSTHFAVAVGLLRIAESILRDQHTVLAVSNLAMGYCGIEDVYFSLPAVVDAGGVERVVCLPLDDREEAALRRSAELLRGVLDQLEV
jgi:L-lactate dehydrogenase